MMLACFGESKTMLTKPSKLAAASSSDVVATVSREMQSRAKELDKEQQN